MKRCLPFAVAAVFGGAAIMLPLAARPTPVLLWNTTASAPVGLYLTAPERRASVGDLVVIRPPRLLATVFAAAGYLPLGVPLVKRIAAVAPAEVCRAGAVVSVNGRPAAVALARDRFGRPLPMWRGCRRLAPGEVFLLNAEPGSLDSRYFGALPACLIVARATPLMVTQGAADAR